MNGEVSLTEANAIIQTQCEYSQRGWMIGRHYRTTYQSALNFLKDNFTALSFRSTGNDLVLHIHITIHLW